MKKARLNDKHSSFFIDLSLIKAEISVTSVNEIIDCENKMLNAWLVSFLRPQNITLYNYKL